MTEDMFHVSRYCENITKNYNFLRNFELKSAQRKKHANRVLNFLVNILNFTVSLSVIKVRNHGIKYF